MTNQPRKPNGQFDFDPNAGASDLPSLNPRKAYLSIGGNKVPCEPVGGVSLDGAAPSASPKLFFKLDATPENAELFRDRIAALKENNPMASAVDVHDADDYLRDDLYLDEDGRTGFAIADGDELVSVFSYKGEHGGDALVEKAVERGARRLDCYDIRGGLPSLYGRHGFRPVARVAWNDEYAPDGWNYERLGRPDVVAMAVADNAPEEPSYMDYDEAVEAARRAAEE
jgi:hypothetical protein